MSIFNKYTSTILKINMNGEEMLNLCELVKYIEADETLLQIEECIITPYYINERGRYELYQYEFCVEQKDGETFEEYILRITGKKKIEEVPDNIIRIRQMCFSKIGEDDQSSIIGKIKDYFYFLISDKEVKDEIIDVFAEFNPNKLFICTY